jgi:E-phenylitaconyl-CoA hydratase
MEATEIVLEKDGPVAVVRLNRPERGNSFTRSMRKPMVAAWHDVEDDPEIRVVIVTGTGSRHFCTGVDVGHVAQTGKATTENNGVRKEIVWSPFFMGVTKPVICAVNGAVVGGGLHFVVDADIVVAGEHVEFYDTHTSLGIVGAVENIGLSRRIPLGTALRMTLEGRAFRLSAARAYQIGLVDELCEQGQELAVAKTIAEHVAANSPRANALSKQAIWASSGVPYEQALEFGWSLARLHWAHPDFKEGPRAFVERRPPEWTTS